MKMHAVGSVINCKTFMPLEVKKRRNRFHIVGYETEKI